MATKPRSLLKGDPYEAYESLPAEVRLALQESLVDWCPLRAREWHLDLLRRDRLRPAQAAAALVRAIRTHDQAEIAAFARTWPKGADAYPHLAAGASLQRYAGAEGIATTPARARPETRADVKATASAGAAPIRAMPGSRAEARAATRTGAAPPRARPGTRAEAKAAARAIAAMAGAGAKAEPVTGTAGAARSGTAARTGGIKLDTGKPSRLKPRAKARSRTKARGKHPAGRRARR
ncbi:Uncharacterised protein [Roseomonas gilardii subsp. rosea]|nr:Uncharacterised protein [Roseomonas gilardii subsp. rosea]